MHAYSHKGRPIKKLDGKKFGKLTVLYRDVTVIHKAAVWVCQCECGQQILATSTHLRSLTHCGCEGFGKSKKPQPGILGYKGKASQFQKPGAMSSERAALNIVRSRYVYGAQIRSLHWCISNEEFDALVSGPCHYCGKEPSSVLHNGDFDLFYNGIDRKEPLLGYIAENCVSCCWKCNQAKNDMGYDEFLTWIARVNSYRRKHK